jgi:hypothetical protein
MRDDRFRPCEIADLGDSSLLNEPAVDIVPRRPPPLPAFLNDVRAHTAALAARLEAGVSVHSDLERDAVRALYLQTRRLLEALALALDVLAADR